MKSIVARVVLLQMAALLSMGAAGSSRGPLPGTFWLRTPSRDVIARVDASGVRGSGFDLRRSSGLLRGTASGRFVSLDVAGNEVTGHIAETTTHLVVSRAGAALEAGGIYAGRPAALKVTDDRITGSVGTCRYDLKGTERDYKGWRLCDNTPQREPARVRLPPELEQYSDPERAAVLAVLLAL